MAYSLLMAWNRLSSATLGSHSIALHWISEIHFPFYCVHSTLSPLIRPPCACVQSNAFNCYNYHSIRNEIVMQRIEYCEKYKHWAMHFSFDFSFDFPNSFFISFLRARMRSCSRWALCQLTDLRIYGALCIQAYYAFRCWWRSEKRLRLQKMAVTCSWYTTATISKRNALVFMCRFHGNGHDQYRYSSHQRWAIELLRSEWSAQCFIKSQRAKTENGNVVARVVVLAASIAGPDWALCDERTGKHQKWNWTEMNGAQHIGSKVYWHMLYFEGGFCYRPFGCSIRVIFLEVISTNFRWISVPRRAH